MNEYYDVAVIGGGIHGVGTAQAVAAAGYSVVVIEQGCLASGTSSRSSKLIHGGLRYLESGQFSVVRECLHERSLLLKLAPDLVKLIPFYIPIYKGTRRRPWQIRSGLMLYSILAGFSKGATFRKVPVSEWGTLDGLNQQNLEVVFQYWDAQTDDAALTRAVMKSAKTVGAELVQHAKFLSAKLHKHGVVLNIEHQKKHTVLKCKVLVNAAGPWVNSVLQLISPKQKTPAIDLVQGTHLVLDAPMQRGVYYMESPQDQRAIFAMPWRGKMLLGTTETPYRGDPAAVVPLEQERTYLLETLCHYFPQYRDNLPEELAGFAGLRVLSQGGGRAFGRSRETVLLWNNGEDKRLLSIYGGKLTAYRATAQHVMKQLRSILPRAKPRADVGDLKLPPA